MSQYRELVNRQLNVRHAGMEMGIVNAGQLALYQDIEKDLLEKYGEPCPEAMVESALDHARILQDHDFHEFKISVKASDVFLAVAAYQALAEACDYPLHIGVTEAGGLRTGTVKSSIGLGALLWAGIPEVSAEASFFDVDMQIQPALEHGQGWWPMLRMCLGRDSQAELANAGIDLTNDSGDGFWVSCIYQICVETPTARWVPVADWMLYDLPRYYEDNIGGSSSSHEPPAPAPGPQGPYLPGGGRLPPPARVRNIVAL